MLRVRRLLRVLRGDVRCFPRGHCSPVITTTFPSMFVLMTFSLLLCEELSSRYYSALPQRAVTSPTACSALTQQILEATSLFLQRDGGRMKPEDNSKCQAQNLRSHCQPHRKRGSQHYVTGCKTSCSRLHYRGIEPSTPFSMTRAVPLILRRIAVRFLACESCCNALSQASSGPVAGSDFPIVFRNAHCERVDVPPKLRLAIPRHLQLAFAA